MSSVRLEYLPADVLGLEDGQRRALAERPRPAHLPGMVLPARLEDVPPREDTFLPEVRAELAAALERELTAFGPHVRVVDAVRRIATPGATLVVAGQQPGFLGGPLYDVYKAFTAIALARGLEALWGTPVIPVFWNHADDHDIAEVHHLWIQNQNLDLTKVKLAGVSSGRTPFARLRIDRERSRLDAIAESLLQNLPPGPTRAEAVELFLPRDGESFSNAFTRVLLELFGEHGLVVLEPDWIRDSLSRSLASVVTSDLAASLEAGSEALRGAGSEPAIDPAQAALLFHHEDDKRRALRFAQPAEGGAPEFRYDGEEGSRTASELAAEIVQEPGAWSAGALLRPLVQDASLPVVAYVGGWGELAYHAQLPPLRERAGVPRTAFVPRLGATVLDEPVRASLAKLGLELGEALAARGALSAEGAAKDEEDPAALALRETARRAAQLLLDARPEVSAVEPGLAQQLKKAAAQLESQVGKIAAKLNRVRANQRGGQGRHQRRLDNALFPRGVPQERIHGALGVVARHGTGWIGEVLEQVDPLPTEHLVIHMEGESA